MGAKNIFRDKDIVRLILIILGSVFSTLVLTFSVLALIRIQNHQYDSASGFLLAIFLVLGLSRLITWVKERTKISFLRFLVLFIFDFVLGIVIYFAKDNALLYSICGGLFCITIILSRIFKIIQNHSIRNIVFNSIIIALFAFLAVGLFIPNENELYSPVVVICIIVAISALAEVFSNATTSLKLYVLFKIIIRTFALEIILGLLTMIVAASLIFMSYEEGIPTFADALWFSFAIVTTIGFGDYTAVTTIGRITAVILGIYGIFVVAVITSIIVNFYNETAGKHDSKELREIDKENKTNKK